MSESSEWADQPALDEVVEVVEEVAILSYISDSGPMAAAAPSLRRHYAGERAGLDSTKSDGAPSVAASSGQSGPTNDENPPVTKVVLRESVQLLPILFALTLGVCIGVLGCFLVGPA